MSSKLIVLDLDGTILRDGQLTPFAAEALAVFRGLGCQVRIVTNNSTVEPLELAARLSELGFIVGPSEIIGSATSTAARLSRARITKVYAIGEPGLLNALAGAGITLCTDDEAITGEAQAVVVGLCRDLRFSQIRAAFRAIQRGAHFWATNSDWTFPVEGGWLDPGAGSIIAAITACSGVKPKVVGKPSPDLIFDAMLDSGCTAVNTIVVGDRLDTDIAAGTSAGCSTWLVLTGVERQIPLGQPGSENLLGLAKELLEKQ